MHAHAHVLETGVTCLLDDDDDDDVVVCVCSAQVFQIVDYKRVSLCLTKLGSKQRWCGSLALCDLFSLLGRSCYT